MDHFILHLKEALNSVSPISETSFEAISTLIEINKFKKGEVFQEFNFKAKDIAFLVQGGMVVSRNEENGEEKVIYFNTPKETPYVGVLESLIQEEESNVKIKAFQDDTVLCCINYKDLIQLYSKFHELETLGRKLLEIHYLIALKQARFRQKKNANEKLTMFQKDYPGLSDILDQKDIASYLGVDASYFSRLKKRIKNKLHLTNVKSRSKQRM